MLVLTRKVGETIILGGDIKITVAGVRGNQVRIGIEAPEEIKAYRDEIYERLLPDYCAPPYG